MTTARNVRLIAGMGTVHRLIMRSGIEEARRIAIDKTERLCVEAAYGILSDENGRIGITHAGFAMAALPHKRTDLTIWKREGGQAKLEVESGRDQFTEKPIGIPYGSMARMILLYLQTRAVKTKSREIEMGASMNAWLSGMNISVGGKTYQIVREQSRRISTCRLTFYRLAGNQQFISNGAFVRDAILPVDSDSERQLPLWQERVRLDEGFYQSLIEHPLPLREAAVQQISSRSVCLDLYVWLAYRLHVLLEPVEIGWPALHKQFGAGYSALRFFRRDIEPSLKLALAVYPEARVAVDSVKGLTLYPSAPPVPERKMVV